MRRPVWTDFMDDLDWRQQGEHDRRHPGKICQRCPSESAKQAAADAMGDYYQHRQWVHSGFTLAVLMTIAAVLILLFA